MSWNTFCNKVYIKAFCMLLGKKVKQNKTKKQKQQQKTKPLYNTLKISELNPI